MKILHISDTHGDKELMSRLLKRNEPVDLLIHSGDVLCHGVNDAFLLKDVIHFFTHYPADKKIFVPGNHDLIFDNSIFSSAFFGYDEVEELKNELLEVATVLINDYVIMDEIKIWGTPYQPIFLNWAFNLKPESLEKKHFKIHDNIDILISHSPPFGILDTPFSGSPPVGDEILLEKINRLNNLKACFFGHIHEGIGERYINNILFKNSAIPLAKKKFQDDFFFVNLNNF